MTGRLPRISKSSRRSSAGSESGVALVMVIVVLVALVLIATPFALSMRHLESGALLSYRRASSRAGAEQAMAAARRHLEDTHPAYDLRTPLFDGRDEISPDDLGQRFPDLLSRDPRGAVRSVRIEDEQGKVHLGTASLALLGNLIGGRAVLTAALGPDSTSLALSSSAGFEAPGLAWVGGEQVAYSGVTDLTLEELQRGFPSVNVPRTLPRPHGAGTEILDARLLLLVQFGWQARSGTWSPFVRVDGLRDLGRFSELTYDAATLDRVRPYLTTHGPPPRWLDDQRVVGVENGRHGRVELVVPDGSRYGPGTVIQLRNPEGELGWNLVLSAVDWGDRWRLGVLEPPSVAHTSGDAVVSALERVPVNLATARPEVLSALFQGIGRTPVVDVITEQEAAVLALLVAQSDYTPDEPEFRQEVLPEIEEGRFSEDDLDTAAAVLQTTGYRPGRLKLLEIAALLVGRETRRGEQRLGRRSADELALRVHDAQPRSHAEFGDLLAAAAADGLIDPQDQTNLARNARSSRDARLVGGTAPFTYASAGLFRIDAAASENLPNGRERSRAHLSEVVSVAPTGDSARLVGSQAAFERLRVPGGGWTTGPHLVASGPGAALPETRSAGTAPSEPLLETAYTEALRLGGEGVDAAGTAEAGRPAASADEERSFATLETVRSALPDTVHFDEGAPGLQSLGPFGYSLPESPLQIPLAGVQPSLVGAESGLLQPFAVEFWFQTDDPQAETMLFDMGVDPLENRVFLMLDEGELVLRVSDTSIPDFEAEMPDEGRPPPAGEIRYAFDDGLALLPGVPYHVLVWIGGARDTQLMLFVDGVPRGQRSFTTWLTDDLDGVGVLDQVSGSLARNETLPVESTAGFPAQGVLRVGWEIVEYIDKTDDSFVLRASSSSDPFGGRARRGSTGGDHEASEVVELMGYSRPIVDSVVPLGNGELGGRLAEFDVAELDPDALTDDLFTEVLIVSTTGAAQPPLEIYMGTGLLSDATTIPVRSPNGGSLDGVYQSDGGYVMLVCDYGNTAVVGQSFPLAGGGLTNPVIPARLTDGSWLGGAEIVRYQSFDGSTLSGCERGLDGVPEGVPSSFVSPLAGESSPSIVRGVDQNWDDDRSFLTTFSNELTGAISGLPDQARVLVIPISLGLVGGGLNEEFNPFPEGPRASLLVQVGIDFPEGGGGTEWIRWNTPTDGALVRDDKPAIEDTMGFVAATDTWIMDNPVDEDLVEGINDALDFRGQGDTEDTSHETDEPVLPVHVLGEWGVSQFDPMLGIPGRHDAVTLVGDDGEKEWHVINHSDTDDLDWSGAYCLVAFRDPVVGDYEKTPQNTLDEEDEGDPYVVADRDIRRAMREGEVGARLVEELQLSSRQSLEDEIRPFNVDVRRVTRLVKAPSGELPDVDFDAVHMGRHHDGRPAAGLASIDELRFHRPQTPGLLLPPTTRYLLADELAYDEDSVAQLGVQDLVYPHARVRASMLGEDKLEVLSELPQSGGLLLVGEEIIGYAGVDPVDTGAIFLTGRGLYGTRRARHLATEPVTPLLFWPVAPLVAGLSEDDAVVGVADPSLFPPEGGLLWVGDELLGYTSVTDEGLRMATRLERPDEGLLRGRFGTLPSNHPAGAMVRWQPARVRDRALLGNDVPEAEALVLPIFAPGAFFTEMALQVEGLEGIDGVELEAFVVLDGLASHHDDPARSESLLRVPPDESTPGVRQFTVGRQADLAELVLTSRWSEDAFDSRDFLSNAWKVAPRVSTVVIKHLQPTVVLEHEEWR